MTERRGIDAERALDSVHSDHAYERALRDAYQGRHDVLDALWWAAHPLTDSAGLADPAVELRELQHAAFARASDQALAAENMRRLQDAQHQLAEDARLLADAVDAADRLSQPPSEDTPGTEADAVPQPRRKLLLPLLSGVALLVAIMVLPALMQPDAAPDPAPASTARPPDRVQTEIVTLGTMGTVTDPLAVLDRAQADTDLPPEGRAVGENLESFRRLPDLAPHVQLYLAREAGPDSVCLVVVRQDSSVLGGCTTAEKFAATGVNVGGGGRYDLSDTVTILSERFTLLPDGDFRFEATARTTGEMAFPQPVQ